MPSHQPLNDELSSARDGPGLPVLVYVLLVVGSGLSSNCSPQHFLQVHLTL